MTISDLGKQPINLDFGPIKAYKLMKGRLDIQPDDTSTKIVHQRNIYDLSNPYIIYNYAKCSYAECYYTEFYILVVVILSFVGGSLCSLVLK